MNLKKILCKDSLNSTLNSTLYNDDKDCSLYGKNKNKDEDLEQNIKYNIEDEEIIKLIRPHE